MLQDPKAGASHLFGRMARDVRGTTAIEYALICSLVFLVIFGSVKALGDTVLVDLFKRTADAMSIASTP